LSAAGIRSAIATTPATVRMLSGVVPYELTQARVLVAARDLARAADTLVTAGWREDEPAGERATVRVFGKPGRGPLAVETSFGGASSRLSIDAALDRAVDVAVADVTLRALAPPIDLSPSARARRRLAARLRGCRRRARDRRWPTRPPMAVRGN
jgi:hypothetical protein